jgi:hypothetical protein
MKKTSLYLTLVLALISTICILSCRPDPQIESDPDYCPEGLPCATKTGKNTFGCYINGAAWVADIGANIFDPTLHKIQANLDEIGYRTDNGGYLSLTGTRTNDTTDGFMHLYIKPVTEVGEINNANAIKVYGTTIISKTNKGNVLSTLWFELDTLFDYKIEITHLDTVKNIVAGRFSFTGTTPSKDTIKVTQGRFDVVYDQY